MDPGVQNPACRTPSRELFFSARHERKKAARDHKAAKKKCWIRQIQAISFPEKTRDWCTRWVPNKPKPPHHLVMQEPHQSPSRACHHSPRCLSGTTSGFWWPPTTKSRQRGANSLERRRRRRWSLNLYNWLKNYKTWSRWSFCGAPQSILVSNLTVRSENLPDLHKSVHISYMF